MAGGDGGAEGRVRQGRRRGEGLCYRSIMVLRLVEGLTWVRMLKSFYRLCSEDILVAVLAHGWRCSGWLLHAMQTTRA